MVLKFLNSLYLKNENINYNEIQKIKYKMYKLSLKPISQYNMIYYDIYYKYNYKFKLRPISKVM